jgi:T5orf172 domain-containing protein
VSWESISWAWNLRNISPTAKLVAIALADCYPPFATETSEDIGRLADFVGIDEAAVVAALDELRENANLIYRQETPTRVSITLPANEERGRGATKTIVKRNERPHWIYVISSKGATKIGISHDVGKRFDTLQAWTPEPLQIEWVGSGPKAKITQIEADCHAELAPHRAFSEWFLVDAATAIKVVKRHMAAHGLRS